MKEFDVDIAYSIQYITITHVISLLLTLILDFALDLYNNIITLVA